MNQDFLQDKIQNIKLVSQVVKSFRSFLEGEGFVEMYPPSIVRASGACESVSTMFEVAKDGDLHWFRPEKPHRAYLTQTAQFYLEAFCPALKKYFQSVRRFDQMKETQNGILSSSPWLK